MSVSLWLAVSDGKQRMRKRTVEALCSHTDAAIDNLKNDEDEMLRGESVRCTASRRTVVQTTLQIKNAGKLF